MTAPDEHLREVASRIPVAFTTASIEDPHAATPDASPRPVDPLRFCVATTAALIAWLITPALALAVFAGLALTAYWRARRAGLLASRCAIGDTRLVLAYLGVLAAAGIVGTVLRFT